MLFSHQKKPSHKRNLVYETKCLTCERRDEEYINTLEIEDKEKSERKRNMPRYKYIGETSRSTFEIAWEHTNDLAQLKTGSHMLKHIVGVHPGEDMSRVQFGIRVIKYCRTSFERQVLESVVIQDERKRNHLLNSRSEYNRCSLPRLCTQIGDSEYTRVNSEIEEEKREEDKLEAKIRELRKAKNKARLHPTKETGPDKKKRRVQQEEYIDIGEIWKGVQQGNRKRKVSISKEDENNAEVWSTKREKIINQNAEKNEKEKHPIPVPTNQTNSKPEFILAGVPLLGPSPHRGSRCGVGLDGGRAEAGGPPQPPPKVQQLAGGEDTPAKIPPKMKQGAITSYFSTPKREKKPLTLAGEGAGASGHTPPILETKPKKNNRKSLPDSKVNKMRGYWVQLAQTRRAKKCESISHVAPICKARDTAATEHGHHILVHHSGPDNPALIRQLHNDISYPKGMDNKK